VSAHTEQHPPKLSWQWVKSISHSLYLLDQKPLVGFCKPFPCDELAKTLAKTLGMENCTLSLTTGEWKEGKECFQGIGTPFFSARLGASGLSGHAFFLISKQDVQKLFAQILHLSPLTVSEQSQDILESFYHFLSIHTLFSANQMRFAENISFSLHSYEEPPQESSFLCRDVIMSIQEETFIFRLLMDKEFMSSWTRHFSTQVGKAKQLDAIPVTLHLEAGKVVFPLNRLLEIEPGDFIICDKMSYNPDDETSKLLLTLDERPLFRASIKARSLKILEIPLATEEYDSMVDKIPPISPTQGHQNSHQDFHEDFFDDDDDDFEDEDFDETEEERVQEEVHEKAVPEKALEKAPAKAPLSGKLTSDDIPVTVTVELAQVTMSAQKLIELQPGNVVELDSSPDGSCLLTTGGKIIGRGEILKIGDTLGIRVLEIGV
jgi:flagellar motor switch protein FliN/FliY